MDRSEVGFTAEHFTSNPVHSGKPKWARMGSSKTAEFINAIHDSRTRV